MAYIYSLTNPLTSNVFYVGYSNKKPVIRLMAHIAQQKLKNIIELAAVDKIPVLNTLEQGDHVTTKTEKEWIVKLHGEGAKLENLEGLLSYEERGYILNAPKELLDKADCDKEDKLKACLELILKELPLSSSIPIVLRIKNICEWGLSD